jgi:hypothetical protein
MGDTNHQVNKNPPGFDLDFDLLQEFETFLDPQRPENGQIPCQVLGYGEISTVFELKVEGMQGLAFKRMSIFKDDQELDKYIAAYLEYNQLLEHEIGLGLPPHGHAILRNPADRPIFYIIQGKLPAHCIGNNAIHLLNRRGVFILIERILGELIKLWSFNKQQTEYQVSLDGQISNWVIDNFDPEHPVIDQYTPLSYVDTSTPVYLHQGVEQFDPELVLRTTPRLLSLIIRMFFLEDVMTRYYDPRKVSIDILANFHKEQRADLIPELVFTVNSFFSEEGSELGIEPLGEQEIHNYYREDAFIWSFLSTARRFDRFLYLYVFRREYPNILPGNVQR